MFMAWLKTLQGKLLVWRSRDEATESSADDAKLIRFGYVIVFLLVVVFGGWASLAPLTSAAFAPGVVQVEGNRKLVQHLEGGLISEILVKSGDDVSQDQVLVLLDATSHKAEKDILQGRYYNAAAAVERLQHERDDLAALAFSNALVTAAASDSRAHNALTSEKTLFEARREDRLGEEAVLNKQMQGIQAVLESKRTIALSIEEEIEDLTTLLEDGFIDRQRLRELERSYSRVVGELTDLEVTIEESRLKVLQLRKRFKTQVVDELTLAQEKLYDLTQQFIAADDRVKRATIRAPVGGIILNLIPNTIGAVVRPGDTLMEIVPQMDDLVIEAQVSPMDIDRVRIGQTAEIRFSVFKDAYMITGIVEKLSPDRLLDAERDFPYYRAEVRLLEQDLYLLEGLSLVPGMPAEVLIETGTRTMLSYIVSPLERLFSGALIED